MKEISITLFAASSPQGRDFARDLHAAFASGLPYGMKVGMRVVYGGDQDDMQCAGMEDDIVVFDASVEDAAGSNYKAAMMWLSTMNHFLVVSRTHLPLNFQPFHEGGSPTLAGARNGRASSLDNRDLIGWVLQQLNLLSDQLPRPARDKLSIPMEELPSNAHLVGDWVNRRVTESVEWRKQQHAWQGRAFVSYLSRYSREHRTPTAAAGYFVEDVVEHVKRAHDDPEFGVLYYPPGTLSGEFMTEHRRWQVVSIIDRKIRAAEEFWIFETDDYHSSWWTLAELACLAYMRHNGTPLPRVFRCQPQGRDLVTQEAGPEFVQVLRREQAREFGRFLSNSDPLTMGYETIRSTQRMRKRALPIQWLGYKSTQILLQQLLASGALPRHLLEGGEAEKPSQLSFAEYRALLNSHVFSPEFMDDRLVTCPNCTAASTWGADFPFDDFMYHRQRGQYRVSKDEFARLLRSGKWRCKNCPGVFRIVEDRENVQFRWWPIRSGRTTGPGGVLVERVPLYFLEPIAVSA